MKICIFHPVRLPVEQYGGTERVVLWLARGLLQLGHNVFVMAKRGSLLPKGITLVELDDNECSPELALAKLPRGCDFLHWMTPPGPFGEETAKKAGVPYVFTLHGNAKHGEILPKNTIFLSKNHAMRHGGSEYVYNGIDPDEYFFNAKVPRARRFLFLAKTSWRVKNLKGAMKLASKAKVPLDIAGGSRPYYLRMIAAIGGLHLWHGSVGGGEKARLLAESCGLLFPVLWHEPFGLAVVEALVSGTPVLGSNQGSLPEIVTNECGRVLDLSDTEAWLSGIELCIKGHFSPEACRARVLAEFHYLRMSERYEACYKRVIAKGKL